jgi:hypothetical protein
MGGQNFRELVKPPKMVLEKSKAITKMVNIYYWTIAMKEIFLKLCIKKTVRIKTVSKKSETASLPS